MSEYYLLRFPQKRPQYGKVRRKTHHNGQLTGAIILHSFENYPDLVGADTSAETKIGWLLTRSDYGSYHTVCDRDSRNRLAPFEYETWHDTTSNNYSIGISVMWRVSSLPTMTEDQRQQYYYQFALAVLEAVQWLKANRGITVPLDRMRTRAEIVAGQPGISTHGRMDPSRRHDPFGPVNSEYEQAFWKVLQRVAQGQGAKPEPTRVPKPTPAPKPTVDPTSQSWSNPPNGSATFPRTYAALVVDGDFGKLPYGALQILMHRIGRRNNQLWDGIGGRRTWKDVQEWLRTLGYYKAPLRIDGDPGKYTIQGLQRFLQSKGLYSGFRVDGVFGPETRKAFQRYLNDQKQFL